MKQYKELVTWLRAQAMENTFLEASQQFCGRKRTVTKSRKGAATVTEMGHT